jgi:antibiotic biosynthesis monooxygenase (ABM) superfamily enzyme
MIERHVTFDVIPGKEAAFEELFQSEYSKAMGRQPGFVSVGLLREAGAPRYQMLVRFESLKTAAAWRDSADHKALAPKIKAFYTASAVQVYDVVA